MLKNMAPKAESTTVAKARKLRRDMSLPEVVLWRELRKRPKELKFRRQHPSGAYILDFFCSDARLAIEIDSFAHNTGDRPQRDVARDAWFAKAGIAKAGIAKAGIAKAGIATLRIDAKDVLADLEAVLAHITGTARNRLPLHHPAAPGGPPPRDKLGEE